MPLVRASKQADTLRDCRDSPALLPRGRRPGPTTRGGISAGICGRLPGRRAERFGMHPAVVLGQDLGEAARPVRDSTAADLAARNRKLGNGHREAPRTCLAHHFYDASPLKVILTVRCRSRQSVLAEGMRSHRPPNGRWGWCHARQDAPADVAVKQSDAVKRPGGRCTLHRR